MREITHHLRHYLPLLGILIAAISGFMIFSWDRVFQFVVVVAASLGYFVWGLVHHHIHKDLHPSVVVEYFAIAILGIVIVFSLLFRV
ncbi:hypothetical protein A2865_03135 [Candidatus Woesebacteria bacterium RIFCSPHIGHO2_01_FULL_39_17]|uniref:Uncharacterized protein n=3 Tax=Candidatus Woeseibacteriota TaxID=1752722 RepID=A0A0G0NBM0_9BACT|nr:MAG: hypothetical protein UT19_C0004G0061 [Candidatus Woesebacteria bacterium GW2011_GWB1_39_10b]KKR13559.1 MAG: hypothetical protein UT40_C0014G0015 [Candidatus Woesebacteria bacterium GW2011_GWA1_39_21b]OGM22557.1 MAG: hypothetical protein A2865_03135 [Candidatus Woesebacteria bacterium RIFCSPHIGHO2_01_FULL_39_17]OGM63680.1 MAG: hypothetical protein A3A52_02550 [Candidatus Woesebacteria bacterium RIFCSPLOWO2_01_FULL_39_14]